MNLSNEAVEALRELALHWREDFDGRILAGQIESWIERVEKAQTPDVYDEERMWENWMRAHGIHVSMLSEEV